MTSQRPSAHLTSRVLTVGSLGAAALVGLGLVLAVAGAREIGGLVGNIGVVVLLGTPAAGLITTWSELRSARPTHALLAVAVLATLMLATVIALLARP